MEKEEEEEEDVSDELDADSDAADEIDFSEDLSINIAQHLDDGKAVSSVPEIEVSGSHCYNVSQYTSWTGMFLVLMILTGSILAWTTDTFQKMFDIVVNICGFITLMYIQSYHRGWIRRVCHILGIMFLGLLFHSPLPPGVYLPRTKNRSQDIPRYIPSDSVNRLHLISTWNGLDIGSLQSRKSFPPATVTLPSHENDIRHRDTSPNENNIRHIDTNPIQTVSHQFKCNATCTCEKTEFVLHYGNASPAQMPVIQEKWYGVIAKCRELLGELHILRYYNASFNISRRDSLFRVSKGIRIETICPSERHQAETAERMNHTHLTEAEFVSASSLVQEEIFPRHLSNNIYEARQNHSLPIKSEGNVADLLTKPLLKAKR